MPEPKLDVNRDAGASSGDDLEDHAWLGREFLTWLLYRVDAGVGQFRDPGGPFSLAFGKSVRFGSMAGFATDLVLKGGAPGHGAESRAAIGSGHMLREAELRLSRNDREWRFVLQADTLDVKALKLPTQVDKVEAPVGLDPAPGEGPRNKRPGRKRPARGEGDGQDEAALAFAERLELLEELDDLIRAAYAEFVRERARPSWRKHVVPALRRWLVSGLEIE
jgi:hypothetical protein